jgi:hypothetical protein
MPGSSSWMPCAPQGVKGLDDDEWTPVQVIRTTCPKKQQTECVTET